MSLSKALEIVSGINEVGNLFQLFGSTVSYLRSRRNNGEQEQQIQEHQVLQLQSDLQILRDTLPSMYDLIDRAEWRSHERCVAQLLPKLKDAVYDAEDLLDEFGWYEIKVLIEGNNSTELSSLIEFFHNVIQGSFNKVTHIQKRLNNLSSQLEKIGLHEATPRFDKSVRPVTTSFPTEAKIFGRENEIEEVATLLGVPNSSSRSSSRWNRNCDAANSELMAAFIPVLPIVGLGGVGKTTLAQEITGLQRVKSHFHKIIWICVSNEFDEERLTKVLIKSLSGKEAVADNFDDVQRDLSHEVGKKRFLLILDDIWLDAVKEDGQNWRKFCAPLRYVFQGSMLLVTTRFVEVAKIVGTKDYFASEEYIELNGLESEDFWDLFISYMFGSENYHIDPDLEQIGRNIAPKLKGNPLAAKTIGRLLQKSLTTKHWNDILNSELWQLQQKETDILPALRLSYMYLPFHLKRCFSFCAVYPKDYNFDKSSLVEIWMAESFVEPEGNIPLQHIGGQYFEDLVNLSFFQEIHDKYVIHDLMHDMAQLVSKDECFIINNASDLEKVPQNTRHLSILSSGDLTCGNLVSLCKHEKLRTLFCKKNLCFESLAPVTYHWFSKLQCMRAISFASICELPENISNLKHLRYLEISIVHCMVRFPSSFSCLHYLQILYAKNYVFKRLPAGFYKLINLQKFEARFQNDRLEFDALEYRKSLCFLKNMSIKELIINNLDAISKDDAAKMDVRDSEFLDCLSLGWSELRPQQQNEMEVLQALHPPTNIKSLHLMGYPGEYLPWGSHPCNLPTSMSALFGGSDGPGNINQNEAPVVIVGSNNGQTCSIFSSLTELHIKGSEQLSSLEQFLQPCCVPAIKRIVLENSPRLSLQSSKVGDLSSLEELMVCDCPNIISGGVFAPYLKSLTLSESRSLGGNLTSIIKLEIWSLPALLELWIIDFSSLTFITKANLSHHRGINSSTGTLSSLRNLTIQSCSNLKNIDDVLSHECLPAIRNIFIRYCEELQCLHGERFGSLSSLRHLEIMNCPRLNWQGGMVLPLSLEWLSLRSCGDMSSYFPGCLENLTSLESLEIEDCEDIVFIPGNLWRNLHSLMILCITDCPDLVSIGGPDAIAHLDYVDIKGCAKLKEIDQPFFQ